MKAYWARLVAWFDRQVLGFSDGGITHVGDAELRINCHGDRLGGYNPTERNPVPEYERPVHPKPWSTWRDTNGNHYIVYAVTNTAVDRPGHPPDVVYVRANNDGRGTWDACWSRPLSDWYRSFTLVE